MQARRVHLQAVVLMLLILLLGGGGLALDALAQVPQQIYGLPWWTIDGGGARSSGGNYLLEGTAGQPDVGPGLSGGGYLLEGGFWSGGLSGVSIYEIYLPLLLRAFP